MIPGIILGVIGAIFIAVGILIWKKQKISFLHDYHYGKVREEDKKRFCFLSGMGIISDGIGILVTAVIIFFTDSALSFIAFPVGFAIGLSLLIYAGRKYNR